MVLIENRLFTSQFALQFDFIFIIIFEETNLALVNNDESRPVTTGTMGIVLRKLIQGIVTLMIFIAKRI